MSDDTTACTHPADGVLWNPWNRVIQCHRCGTIIPGGDLSAEKPEVP